MHLCRARELVNIKHIRRYQSAVTSDRLRDFPERYNSKETEREWYEVWEANNYFQNQQSDKLYQMILPPPNVTGTLHLGHALTVTVQDILARWYRMKGFHVNWIPGFDHAGIATQAIVEKYLMKTKNIRRNKLSKSEFLEIINEWKDDKSSEIRNQLKAMGASLDWSKEYFTMNNHHTVAVKEAFCTLSSRKLLYRDKSLVNWSPALGSTLSDIEVETETINGKVDLTIPGYNKKVTFGQIYEISYDLVYSDEQLTVATTRPETLLGDVALAVHPNDERYSKFIGQQVRHPLKKNHLPIIADPNVKMDFGTGVVKITPAHDKLDYTIAKNHNLNMIEVINEDGKLVKEAGRYQGMPRFLARENVLIDLSSLGCLKSVKDHKMVLPRCSRTGDVIELLLREQWFVNCKTMASRAYEAVKNGSLKLNPSIYNDTWFDWLNDSKYRDWCVSRQLWWGHQIPAYYCKVNHNKEWIVAPSRDEAMEVLSKQYGKHVQIYQDTDVLDTWFSSALLPLSCAGWPKNMASYEKYYPLSLMETGNDILFFWVARMVMLGLELTNKLPFPEVLLHGILCDAQEIKMSKSRGNVILPENVKNGISLESLNEQAENSFFSGVLNLDEFKRTVQMNEKNYPKGIPQCGVDALRFTLCSQNIKERAVSFDISACEQNKFFFNKIWQASKYLLRMTDSNAIAAPKNFTNIDQWILSRLSFMVETVNNGIEDKAFYKAVSSIKEFLYYEFCDYYLEGTKPGFRSKDSAVINSHRYTLAKCLEVTLRILAPITPYLSDDLYSKLSKRLSIFNFKTSLLESRYPDKEEIQLRNIDIENEMTKVIKLIKFLRSLLNNVAKRNDAQARIIVNTEEDKKLYQANLNLISGVSKVHNLSVINVRNFQKGKQCIFGKDEELNCSVALMLNNETLFNEAKKKFEKSKLQAESKLKDEGKLNKRKLYPFHNSKLKKDQQKSHVI